MKERLINVISCRSNAKNKSWYEIKAEADDVSEVMIYDEIGWFGVTAKQFVSDLNNIKSKTIKLRLNSPGGDVFDGVAIYNALKDHPAKVITNIEGLAASISSIIALAGDEVHMASNAFFMIHNPWILSIGEAEDLRHDADLLDKITKVIVDTYAKATGNTKHQIKQWMSDETWFTAKEAKDAGFVDQIGSETEAKASFDLSVFANAPAALCGKKQSGDSQPSIRDTERLLRDAGFSRSQAAAIVAGGYKAISLRDAGDEQNELLAKLLETIKG